MDDQELDLPALGAALLFTTIPTDRALMDWAPPERRMAGRLSERDTALWLTRPGLPAPDSDWLRP